MATRWVIAKVGVGGRLLFLKHDKGWTDTTDHACRFGTYKVALEERRLRFGKGRSQYPLWRVDTQTGEVKRT